MNPRTILLVSDEAADVGAIRAAFPDRPDWRLTVCSRIGHAPTRMEDERVELVVVRLNRAGQDAELADLLRRNALRAKPKGIAVLDGEHDSDRGAKLLRLGARIYLRWPLQGGDLSALLDDPAPKLVVRKRDDDGGDSGTILRLGDGGPFFYDSVAGMGRLMDQVRRVAAQDTTILLGGETGTGKTRLARIIHDLSPRRGLPFLVINCGALSTNLIESEMFGHIRGSFTGADRDRIGKFAEVGRGTLLLDEVDSLPLETQAKLLRVIEDRMFEPVGSNGTQPVRARLIAAANRPLNAEVAAGRFREDLYYRLNVIGFTLPSLRERPESIAPIARSFVAEFAARTGCEDRGLSDEAIRTLEAHHWPGNIRELRNVIERAVVLTTGPIIEADDLIDSIPGRAAAPVGDDTAASGAAATRSGVTTTRFSLIQARSRAEMDLILETLRKNHNNRSLAAAELGISRMTLYKKMHRYGIFQVVA